MFARNVFNMHDDTENQTLRFYNSDGVLLVEVPLTDTDPDSEFSALLGTQSYTYVSEKTQAPGGLPIFECRVFSVFPDQSFAAPMSLSRLRAFGSPPRRARFRPQSPLFWGFQRLPRMYPFLTSTLCVRLARCCLAHPPARTPLQQVSSSVVLPVVSVSPPEDRRDR